MRTATATDERALRRRGKAGTPPRRSQHAPAVPPVLRASRPAPLAPGVFDQALLRTGCLADVAVHLRVADLAHLACTSRALHAFLRDARFLWADLARQWRLPLEPLGATFARVGALLRLAHLQLVPVAAAVVVDAPFLPHVLFRPPRTRAARRTVVTLGVNLDCLAVALARVPAPASRLPRRASVLGGDPVPPTKGVLRAPAAFDRVLLWRNVRGWALYPQRKTLLVVFQHAPGDGGSERSGRGGDGQLVLVDEVPQLLLLIRVFSVYTDLGCLWTAPGPLLR